MAEQELRIVDGPDKPRLQWALIYPERNLRVHFNTDDDIFNASVAEMEELEDGLSFRLTGAIETGALKGAPFHGVYSVGSRTGVLKLVDRHS
jgi:hypothetical protein